MTGSDFDALLDRRRVRNPDAPTNYKFKSYRERNLTMPIGATKTKPSKSKRANDVGRERTQEPDPTTPEGQWALYLCKLMDDRGINADKLAGDAGVARSLIFKYRRGETVPSIRVWGTLAAALGLSDWRSLVPPDAFVKSLKKKR